MYVLLASIVEMLKATCDIIIVLNDMNPPNSQDLAAIEKHLLNMIRCALDSYEQALEQSLQTGQNKTAKQNED